MTVREGAVEAVDGQGEDCQWVEEKMKEEERETNSTGRRRSGVKESERERERRPVCFVPPLSPL